MAKFDKEAMQKSKLMVANLKSTGQSKFALDDTKEEVRVVLLSECQLYLVGSFVYGLLFTSISDLVISLKNKIRIFSYKSKAVLVYGAAPQ